jgi:hypothetical protein
LKTDEETGTGIRIDIPTNKWNYNWSDAPGLYN